MKDVTLNSEDTVMLWAEAMEEVTVDGVTGPMAFSRTGIRTMSTYHIKSFVPLNSDEGCSYNVSDGSNAGFPWLVETRAILTITNGPPVLQFLNCSGSPTNDSVLVFSGGTTAIPKDNPGRLFARGVYDACNTMEHARCIHVHTVNYTKYIVCKEHTWTVI